MENIILRAMRTFDESVCAPEYARNQLAIEIIFPEAPVFINELAVRVYSEDYQLIGADVYSPSSRKTPRKVRFIVLSDTFWDENLYHIFRISERTSQMDCFSVSLAFLRGMEKREVG